MIPIDDDWGYRVLQQLTVKNPKNKLRKYQGRIECMTCKIAVPLDNQKGHDGHLFVYLDEDKWV